MIQLRSSASVQVRDIESEIRLFADNCVCYREMKDEEDTMNLQMDNDPLGSWARKWGMRFQPFKCNMMQLTRKQIKKIHASNGILGFLMRNLYSCPQEVKEVANKGLVRPVLDYGSSVWDPRV